MSTTGAFRWVADLYDSYVTTTVDVPFFVEKIGSAAGPILELMAGTGRLSIPMARAGAKLTSVDLSDPMLDKLREKLAAEGLRADVVAADVAALDLARRDYDLVLLPFQSLGELVNVEDQRAALDRVAEHMAPDGRFICTMHNPPIRSQSVDGQLRLMGRFPVKEQDRTLLFWMVQQMEPDSPVVSAVQLYELYDADGLLTEKRKLDVRFRLVDQDEFLAMATDAGFAVETLYGNYDRSPFVAETSPVMIWVLRRGES
jgi:SAM-dependent methyltransferase